MKNEFYYLSELESSMEKFINKETVDDNPFGLLPENISKRMAEAAFLILQTNAESSQFTLDQNGITTS